MLLVAWLLLTQGGRQSLAIAWIGLATVPERLGATSVVVVGIAGVVGVLVALQAMAAGFEATLDAAGRDDTVLVLRAGANAELSSALDRPRPRSSPRPPGSRATRAMSPSPRPRSSWWPTSPSAPRARMPTWRSAVSVPPSGHCVRRCGSSAVGVFHAGRRELIVGEGALRQFRGLEIGDRLNLNNQDGGSSASSPPAIPMRPEVWGDAESLMAAYRRNGFQSVAARLTAPEAIAPLRAALAADPRLRVDVETTRAYYSKQSERLTKVIRGIGTGVAVIMALGAVFGALNTMYAAVANRAARSPTLARAGIHRVPVVVAVMLRDHDARPSLGGLGAGIAWACSTASPSPRWVQLQPGRAGPGPGGSPWSPAEPRAWLQWALAIGLRRASSRTARCDPPVTVALRES